MKEKPKSQGNTKPHDKKISIRSMEIPPKKPATTDSASTPTSKPNKKQ